MEEKFVQILAVISAMFIHSCLARETSNSTMSVSNTSCPFGRHFDSLSGECQCSVTFSSIVKCNDDEKNPTVSLPFCYCISYNEHFKTITVGYCVERCHINEGAERPSGEGFRYYVIAKSDNLSKANDELCRGLEMNRTGQMCGSCLKGYAPAIYSYYMDCTSCNSTNTAYNLLKYIAMAYGPLTVFYIIVIMFRISISSGEFNGYILTSQLLVAPALSRLFTRTFLSKSDHSNSPSTRLLVVALATFYGIFNLDFFRYLYPLFCIHPDMTMIQTLALDYAVAIYPLLLIVGTFILVHLHSRYSLVVRLWRPFYKCFIKIRTEWDLTVSLIDAFATFVLLSYVKILNTSLDLLMPVVLYDGNGTALGKLYLRVSGAVEYFGHDHIPYAVIAIIMMTVFNIVPLLLLCLYPCLWFQRCLNFFNIRRQTLHAFMEVFYGCFKTHPRDFRHFAAFYFLIRYVNIILLSLINGFSYIVAYGIVMTVSALVIALVQPHRRSTHSKIDAVMMVCIGVSAIIQSENQYAQDVENYHKDLSNTIAISAAVMHSFYGIGLMAYILLPQRRIKALLVRVYNKLRQKTAPQVESESEIQQMMVARVDEDNESTPLIINVA